MTALVAKLRKPLLIVALVLILLALLVEAGSALIPTGTGIAGSPTPGYGIPYLAMIDALLVTSVFLIALSLLIPERVHGRIQGIITLIVSILVIIAAFFGLIEAFILLIIMVSLLFAVPFGTIAYFALYADFNRDAAAATLSIVMFLKLVFAVCLVLAHQRFLKIKSLVLMIVTTLLATLIVRILHGFVPSFLVSITDTIAAIINAILALIWGILYLIFSIIAVIKVLRIDRALSSSEG